MKKWILLVLDCKTLKYSKRLLPAKDARQASDRVNNDRMAVVSVSHYEGKEAATYMRENRKDEYEK